MQQQQVEQPKVGSKVPSSSGGWITYTSTGLVHTAGKRYKPSKKQAEDNEGLDFEFDDIELDDE